MTTTAIVFTALLPAHWTGYEESGAVAWKEGRRATAVLYRALWVWHLACPYRRDGRQCAAGRDPIMYGPDQQYMQ